VTGLAIGASLLPAPAAHHGLTLGAARARLARRELVAVDRTQPDLPHYDLTFTRAQARALRRLPGGKGFAYAGPALDVQTDRQLRVVLTLTPRGSLRTFRGPPADTSQPSFPIHAAFYYAWYPEAWTRGTTYPYTLFHPSLDYYDADDPHVVRSQIDAMLYAHLDAGIYSWFGEFGSPDTDARFWRYLAAARTTPFRWAIYYEPEGYGDPSIARIHADLEYIRDSYASQPAYLKVGGRFVVFVYGDAHDSCATADRWRAADSGIDAYLVLKAFAGYATCASQPDAWHQYSASLAEYELPSSAFMISPGFDEDSEATPRLSRTLTGWRQSIADMTASGLPWELVLTFNEWAEGTAVEAAREWETPSGYGAYLDALHDGLP
jgi:hypothetical protein